ncbi:MAG TPA: tRNA (adenosine(37)-N6)-threonylcarbamoyltransferase complex ATPase subunit type 1 TsaE [Burkholderiaceae bacterium]|nr:tRNA (adenosine(37)-N6)-threonylcarbamoyltransferase complex ATPase subunit type 1 TsaE [Burkholderiaceae bacterium]
MSVSLVPEQFFLRDESATARLGTLLAEALLAEDAQVKAHGFTLALSGDLGAGKTTLVRACLRRLGVTGPVKSPTFALLELYVVSSLNFYHFDFYRFGGPEEFADSGFRECFGPGNICAIEWPERAAGQLPTADLEATLKIEDEARRVALLARTGLGAACLQRVRTAMARDQGATSAGA